MKSTSAASKKIALSRITLPSIALILTSNDLPIYPSLPSATGNHKSGSVKPKDETGGKEAIATGPLPSPSFDFMKTIDLRDDDEDDNHEDESSARAKAVRFWFDLHKIPRADDSDEEDEDEDTDSIRTVFHSQFNSKFDRPATSRGFRSVSDRCSPGQPSKQCSESTSTPSLLKSVLGKLRPARENLISKPSPSKTATTRYRRS